jgi:hypothetical protein
MSSDELSPAEDSQDEVLSIADDDISQNGGQNGEAGDNLDDLFGDDGSEQDQEPLVLTMSIKTRADLETDRNEH